MLRIEIDHVLRYVATGEDESLVLDGLRVQRDAAAVLGQARAALELLGPAGLGAAAAERLAKVVRVVEGPETPDAVVAYASRRPSGSATLRSLSTESRFAGFFPDLAGDRRQGPALPPGLRLAVAAGADQRVLAGTAVLHKPFVKRDRGGPERAESASLREPGPPISLDASINELAEHSLAPESYDRAPAAADFGFDAEPPPDDTPILRSGARFEAPGGATIELSCQTDTGGDWLRVVLTGGRAAAQPLLVTCIPATGPIARVTTDAAGTAVLPWPAPGAGVLRVDADRTVEIALKVEL